MERGPPNPYHHSLQPAVEMSKTGAFEELFQGWNGTTDKKGEFASLIKVAIRRPRGVRLQGETGVRDREQIK
jgi:hypothetical protein